jgi:hypothetical protein
VNYYFTNRVWIKEVADACKYGKNYKEKLSVWWTFEELALVFEGMLAQPNAIAPVMMFCVNVFSTWASVS